MCIRSRESIPSGGNLYFRVFTNQLIVINKYAWICSEADHTKFIKVICTQITDIKLIEIKWSVKR